MKFNFYALFIFSLATYGILNAATYKGAEKMAHDNGKAVWNISHDKQDLYNHCESLYSGDPEKLKACKMAAITT